MNLTAVNLFIAISAVWRLASMFANETGPFNVFGRLRAIAYQLSDSNRLCKAFRLSEGLECEWCNSVWFGAFVAVTWLVFGDAVILASLPLALSTWAIVIKYVVQTLEQLKEYIEQRLQASIPLARLTQRARLHKCDLVRILEKE